jgi:hypothetical protein
MAGELVPDRRDLRASHEDRDRVAEQLRVAAGDGRLTADELDERLEVALTARTHGELEALLTDLPVAVGVAPAAVKDLVRIEVGSGSAQRQGAWVVPRRLDIEVRSGRVRLDFTEAVISQPVLEITASVRSGSLSLVVPPDVVVDTDDVAVQSGVVKQRPHPTVGAEQVRLRVHVSGAVRSGRVVVRSPRGPRRSFWEWLLRRPRPVQPALPR